MRKLFGTDGIRGRAGVFPLDRTTMCRLGESLGELGHRKILIGADTRESGPLLARWINTGLSSQGGQVTFGGILPTAAVSYLCREGFDLGVVISASHNPADDNGVKVFTASGLKLSETEQNELEKLLALPARRCSDAELPKPEPELAGNYVRFLQDIVATPWSPLRVVVDTANGAAFQLAPLVLRGLGADVIVVNDSPDGRNINDGCGALHPESIAELVRESEAAIGLAFDGDADRLIAVDETGVVRDGDYILFVLARFLKSMGQLATSTVVSTVMANLGLEVALQRESVRLLRTSVGDRFVLEEMLRGGHPLGGEQSGHVILNEHLSTGDGLLTAIALIDILQQTGESFAHLCRDLEKFPQRLVNVEVQHKPNLDSLPEVVDAVQSAEQELAGTGRILLRYSGTENIARVMVEGQDQTRIDRVVETIADVLRTQLGHP